MPPETKESFFEIEDRINIHELIAVLHKRRWVIIISVIVFTTLTLIYSFMTKPVYRATSRIMIETRPPKIVEFQDVVVTDFYNTTSYFNSQIEILKSNSIASLVLEKLSNYQPWSRRGKKASAKDDISAQDKMEDLLRHVKIKPVMRTQLIEISVEDIDPRLAAKIASYWVSAYMFYAQKSRSALTQYAAEWLEKAIAKSKEKLRKSEKTLQEYSKSANILVDKDLKETTFLDELNKKRAEIEAELAEPMGLGSKAELKAIEDRIALEKKRLLELKDSAIQYNILSREVETNKALYESLLNRLKETKSIEGLNVSNIKLVDEAVVPETPVRPKKLLNVILAFLIGVAMGTGGAMLLESLDQSVKSIDDIQKILSIPLLGSVPLPKQDEKNILPALMTLKHPSSVVTEAYKSLRTNIMFSNPDMRKKTIVVTSAGPREGKTTVATNLATAMAHAGERTLLIDADFRYPKLHEIFGLSRKNGITEILSGKEADISSYINKTSVAGLDVLLCGAIPPNPSELLGSKSMQLLMEKLCKIYDRIVFDTPPVLAVTDAVILATIADATIFVTMSGQTYKKSAVRAIAMLNSVETKLLGVVLNAVRPSDHGGYYHYYYNSPDKRKEALSADNKPHEIKPKV